MWCMFRLFRSPSVIINEHLCGRITFHVLLREQNRISSEGSTSIITNSAVISRAPLTLKLHEQYILHKSFFRQSFCLSARAVSFLQTVYIKYICSGHSNRKEVWNMTTSLSFWPLGTQVLAKQVFSTDTRTILSTQGEVVNKSSEHNCLMSQNSQFLRFISTVGIDFREKKITWRGQKNETLEKSVKI